MAFFDYPLEKLQTLELPNTEPADFDTFWQRTLDDAAKHPLAAKFQKLTDPFYKTVDAYDVTFNGFGGQPIKGWFIKPAGIAGKLPCLVHYLGYSCGRGFAHDHMHYSTCGVAVLVMDTRGQGYATGNPGDTADPEGAGPSHPGWMTRGIESPETYFYRRVFTDAARAVDAAAACEFVDPGRIAVGGASQGGGITIAAAALSGKKVKLAMPDVPFLCGYRRAVNIVDSNPYFEISNYCKTFRERIGQVFKTLAYFDGVNFAPRITARCLFSVGLMDNVCPPSTVFGAYNRVSAPKDIKVYEFNNHEGGGPFHLAEKLRFLTKWL